MMLQIAWVAFVILMIFADFSLITACIYFARDTAKEREWFFFGAFIFFIMFLIVGTFFAVATFPGWDITT